MSWAVDQPASVNATKPMFMYETVARGPCEVAAALVSGAWAPNSFSSCFTRAIESARAMLSARAIESCFDLGGLTWARAADGATNAAHANKQNPTLDVLIARRRRASPVECLAYMKSPENVFLLAERGSGFSGRRSTGVGEKLRVGQRLRRRAEENDRRDRAARNRRGSKHTPPQPQPGGSRKRSFGFNRGDCR